MRNNNSFSFNNEQKEKSNLKLYLSIFLFIVIVMSLLIYQFFSYRLLIKNFTSSFDKNKFSVANNIAVTSENFNPFKMVLLENDLSNYFNNKLNSLSDSIASNKISLDDAIDITKEINRYNLSSIDTSNILTESSNVNSNLTTTFNKAVSLFNAKEYTKAYETFSKITSNDPKYNSALLYLDKCKTYIKSDLLLQIDDLSSKHYYTKALNLIEEVRYILGNDTEINIKIDELKKGRSDYLAKQNEATQTSSSNVINNITSANINNLLIESITPYLIHVDLDNQKTYIYKGTLKNWNLEKTFPCSTGTKGKETPEGVYTIKEKGKWFFSDKYNQGGKYWVQFFGDYLFHSLPYNKEKTDIVDYTLGKPSSHGCIRLKEEDSKWIYDNIPKGSKVIIK